MESSADTLQLGINVLGQMVGTGTAYFDDRARRRRRRAERAAAIRAFSDFERKKRRSFHSFSTPERATAVRKRFSRLSPFSPSLITTCVKTHPFPERLGSSNQPPLEPSSNSAACQCCVGCNSCCSTPDGRFVARRVPEHLCRRRHRQQNTFAAALDSHSYPGYRTNHRHRAASSGSLGSQDNAWAH